MSRPELSDSLGYLMKHAHQQLSAVLTEALAPLGLDPRELGVLVVLAGPQPVSQHEAAQRLGADRTTMVGLVDSLEDKGIVTRRPDPHDRRRNVVELTTDGRALFRRAVRARDAAERAFLAPVGSDAADGLRRSLTTLIVRPDQR